MLCPYCSTSLQPDHVMCPSCAWDRTLNGRLEVHTMLSARPNVRVYTGGVAGTALPVVMHLLGGSGPDLDDERWQDARVGWERLMPVRTGLVRVVRVSRVEGWPVDDRDPEWSPLGVVACELERGSSLYERLQESDVLVEWSGVFRALSIVLVALHALHTNAGEALFHGAVSSHHTVFAHDPSWHGVVLVRPEAEVLGRALRTADSEQVEAQQARDIEGFLSILDEVLDAARRSQAPEDAFGHRALVALRELRKGLLFEACTIDRVRTAWDTLTTQLEDAFREYEEAREAEEVARNAPWWSRVWRSFFPSS